MYGLEIYHRVRRAVLRDGMSEREAARAFGIDRGTVSKMLRFSEPPGYRRTSPRPRSRMDAHADFVDHILLSMAPELTATWAPEYPASRAVRFERAPRAR
jgi:transposase